MNRFVDPAVFQYLLVTLLLLVSFLNALYAAIAYRWAQAAAAMPFAVIFDERQFWFPIGMAVVSFLAALAIAMKR
jgi:hypothetical protein